jgi:hypothetical protein
MLPSRLYAPLLFILLLAFLPGCDWTVQIGDPGTAGPLGDAIDNPGDWTWVPVEGARCRDGSETGFGVRLQERSRELLIYLEGGSACFNEATCRNNQDNFGRFVFEGVIGVRGDKGIFASRNENPFAGWNTAYVPYCTGDVHAGSVPDVQVEGVDADSNGTTDTQQFVGHLNVERYLDILAERYADSLNHVVLTGSSAGGFGTLVNYEAVRAAFPDARVTLLNDSGPPVASDDVLTPALEAHWVDLWNIESSLSAEASAAMQREGLSAIYASHSDRYPDQTFGLLSYLEDGTIRNFYGYRHPDCDAPDGCVSGNAYAQALGDVREQEAPAWGTYYAEGTDHTFLVRDRFYDVTVAGTPLTDWTRELVTDGNAQDVAP